MKRKDFLKSAGIAGIALSSGALDSCANEEKKQETKAPVSSGPKVISTWSFGIQANQKAMELIQKGRPAIDAVEAGVRVTEADEKNSSVGIGGLPDRDGHVTLDASIMDSNGNAGAVSFLEHIKHPISVARKVMDETPHVMLSGEGALQFALEKGFKKEELLTEKAEKAWEKWKKESNYEPWIGVDNHDTIGLLAIDKNGDMAGACTTSGLAYKLRGRVGDSPIIGAALFVDNEVGGATATGVGEMVIKSVGSFLIVELMRQGASPEEACKEAIERIMKKQEITEDTQVGFIAMNKTGEAGSCAIRNGFSYAFYSDSKNVMIETEGLFM